MLSAGRGGDGRPFCLKVEVIIVSLMVQAFANPLFYAFTCLKALLLVASFLFVSGSAVEAQTHIVVDRNTNEVLSHHRANRRWAPASLTKVMTAYVALNAIKLQQLKLNSPVGVSANALSQPPTKMGFPVGTVLTLENAIKLIMVKSANDVSVAIAESVAGDEATFIRLMNAHARRLGMKDTLYQNPHGLPDPLQYSSAADQARLAIAVRRDFPQYAYLFSVEALKIGRRTLRNFNRLLTRFEGTDGMKTGFICASGYNVIVTSKRKGRELVAVVLGERSGRRRNIKAAQVLANVPPVKGDKAGVEFPELHEMPRVVDQHAANFDLHAPEDIAHQVCRRKYSEPVTAQSAVEKLWDREVLVARKEEIQRVKAARLAEKKAASAQAKAEENDVKELSLVPASENQIASASVAIEVLTAGVKIPLPKISPKKKKASGKKKTNVARADSTNDTKPPSIAELEKKYFLQKIGPAEVQLVRLGGAFGPNPHGIPVLNGSAYPKNIPVPGSRPELICQVDEKAEELPLIEVKPFEKPEWNCLPVPLQRSAGLAGTVSPKVSSQENGNKSQGATGGTGEGPVDG